jgi:PhzF family phenazine biosynthesis protein
MSETASGSVSAIPLWQVDAFTGRPWAGNPAAVCRLPAPAEPGWMQAVAAEMNLSETAFLVRRGDGSFDLRWFTPATEVDLCGHATLASAHALWESGGLEAGDKARFHTASGLLTAVADGGEWRPGGWIEMDFPAKPPVAWEGSRQAVAAALGVDEASLRALAANGMDLLVELASESEVRSLAPDFRRVGELPVRGLIATAATAIAAGGAGGHAGGCDFVSRFFAPAVGVPEDPVTGSAHCALGPWWAERLGKRRLTGYQASARGGEVRVSLEDDRVRLGGQAVTVLEGRLRM